ncbi:MAG: MerR family transcriptional regulator [Acidobacteriia bacterium]|nr:MerR family transcriptional regulator [Terriglobia bacterium]
MPQRYTRGEVGRILGVEPRQLRYWERLRLVRPQARWGERFYSFGDLVALRTVKDLTDKRIPAQRLRRAMNLVEQQFGASRLPLQELRFFEQGRDVLVIPPGAARPFSPLKQQWCLPFDSGALPAKLQSPRSCFNGLWITRSGRGSCRRRPSSTGGYWIWRRSGLMRASTWAWRCTR